MIQVFDGDGTNPTEVSAGVWGVLVEYWVQGFAEADGFYEDHWVSGYRDGKLELIPAAGRLELALGMPHATAAKLVDELLARGLTARQERLNR